LSFEQSQIDLSNRATKDKDHPQAQADESEPKRREKFHRLP